MKKMKAIPPLLLITAFVTACISLGVRVDPQKVGLIKHGETTKEEVIQLFGNPWMKGEGVTEQATRVETWVWVFATSDGSGTELAIDFSDNSVLSYQFAARPY
jgi:outer membrane protein assembly factor BamE (lipoprotein component of BamABCDE complex)